MTLMVGASIASCSKDEETESESGEVIETGTAIKISSTSKSRTVDGCQDTGADDEDLVPNSSASGVAYELKGSTTSGSFKIYSDKKFKVTLNGVSITFIVLADGTENKLTDAATYATSTEDQKAQFSVRGN